MTNKIKIPNFFGESVATDIIADSKFSDIKGISYSINVATSVFPWLEITPLKYTVRKNYRYKEGYTKYTDINTLTYNKLLDFTVQSFLKRRTKLPWALDCMLVSSPKNKVINTLDAVSIYVSKKEVDLRNKKMYISKRCKLFI